MLHMSYFKHTDRESKECSTVRRNNGYELRCPNIITKTGLFKILQILSPKNENFQIKKSDIFHVSAQNIDCGYSLEPPRRGGSNEYT